MNKGLHIVHQSLKKSKFRQDKQDPNMYSLQQKHSKMYIQL